MIKNGICNADSTLYAQPLNLSVVQGVIHTEDIMRKIQQGAEYEETLLAIIEQLQAAELNPVDSIERVIDALLDRYSVIAKTVKNGGICKVYS